MNGVEVMNLCIKKRIERQRSVSYDPPEKKTVGAFQLTMVWVRCIQSSTEQINEDRGLKLK